MASKKSAIATTITLSNPTVEKHIKAHSFSVASMFSGVGGLDMGFEGDFVYKRKKYPQNAFKIVAAYEKDAKCVETVRANLQMPIQCVELTPDFVTEIPKADVLIGGFPCQDFSSCGPKRGLKSERGNLYKVMTAYLKQHQPLVFCAENVPHLAKMDQGKILKTIINDFTDQGYNVQIWNLYAPDYGIPQTRRRLFIVGSKKDISHQPEAPIPTHLNKHRTISWAINDLIKITDESMPNQSQYFKASKAKKGNGQGDEKSAPNSPGYTVRANAKSRVHFHHSLDRRLTVRECARLQTFPDTFTFPHSATSNIMQIGNAVPPLLAYNVAKQIEKYLYTI